MIPICVNYCYGFLQFTDILCRHTIQLIICLFSVTKFAKEVVAPLVQEMDETSHMPACLIKDLFEHGVSTGTLASIVSILGQCFPAL